MWWLVILGLVIGSVLLVIKLKKKTSSGDMGQSRPISYERMAGYSVITALFDKSGDFDYVSWLNKLCDYEFNYTRIFLTLEFCLHCDNSEWRIMPWKEISIGKWNLEEWEELYWKRLRNFVKLARHKGIITCLSIYDNWAIRSTWDKHPFNQANNVNEIRANCESWEHTSDKMKNIEYKFIEKIMQELKDLSDAVILEVGNENQESKGWHQWVINCIKHINNVQGSKFKISLNTIGDDEWHIGNDYYSIHGCDADRARRKANPGCILSTDGLDPAKRYNPNVIYIAALETFKRSGHFSQHSTNKDISNMREASKPNEVILDAIRRAKRDSYK